MTNQKQKTKREQEKPDIWLREVHYQPTKAELGEDMSIDTTPEELARVALRPVNVKIIGKDK